MPRPDWVEAYPPPLLLGPRFWAVSLPLTLSPRQLYAGCRSWGYMGLSPASWSALSASAPTLPLPLLLLLGGEGNRPTWATPRLRGFSPTDWAVMWWIAAPWELSLPLITISTAVAPLRDSLCAFRMAGDLPPEWSVLDPEGRVPGLDIPMAQTLQQHGPCLLYVSPKTQLPRFRQGGGM